MTEPVPTPVNPSVAPLAEEEPKQKKEGDDDSDIFSPGLPAPDVDEQNEFDGSGSAMNIASIASGVNREKWGNKTQFLMSCIASAVGLGNVWRFPAVCAKNGGAAFLFPYLIVLFVIAKPLFVLELTLGQFSSKGSVRCWDLSPMFHGIGYAGMASSLLLSTFYIMLLAWAIIYAALSAYSMFVIPPIWSDEPFSDPGPFFGAKILGQVDFNAPNNMSKEALVPIWHLVVALFTAWLLIWATMVFGVKASGKVAYVTALAPYFVLFVLLIVGCTLGALVGIKFLVIPEWKKLIEPKAWFEAVGQCFFSLGIGFGGCVMFSSFNEFHHPIMSDVLIVSLVDMTTSVLAGFSLMSILGFEANKLFNEKKQANITEHNEFAKTCKRGSDDDSVKICYLYKMVGESGGAGLAFVHYPTAMTEIQQNWGRPWGGLLAFLFFVMLILLATGSANGFVGTTVTIVCDWKPKWKRSLVVTGVCGVSCFIGLIYTNGLGSNWFDLVDMHGVTAVVYILSFLEVVAVVYVYGLKNYCDDMQFMRNGKKVGWYLAITWVILPFIMLFIFGVWLYVYKPQETWTLGIKISAWALTVAVISIIPLGMLTKYIEFKKKPWRKHVSPCVGIIKPSPKWGPKDPEIRIEWKKYKKGQDSSYHLWERFVLCRKIQSYHPSRAQSCATCAVDAKTSIVKSLAAGDSELQNNEGPQRQGGKLS